jgi:hypothetical protein
MLIDALVGIMAGGIVMGVIGVISKIVNVFKK